MHRAFKFRLYPTSEQINLINRTIGCGRYAYNHFLAERINAYESGQGSLGYVASCTALTQLKKDVSWLKEVDSMALQQSLKDLDRAYQKFFNERTGFHGLSLSETLSRATVPTPIRVVFR